MDERTKLEIYTLIDESIQRIKNEKTKIRKYYELLGIDIPGDARLHEWPKIIRRHRIRAAMKEKVHRLLRLWSK